MKNFYREYKLKKDLPEIPKDTLIKWDYWIERYTDLGVTIGLNHPEPKVKYTRDFILKNTEWFEPVSKAEEFYPKFKTRKELFNNEYGCVNIGESRHNNMCRNCQLLDKLNVDEKIKDAVYKVLKEEYEKNFKS